MIRRMKSRNLRAKCFQVLALGLAGAFIAVFVLGQNITDDEIRWGARPYAPQPENAIRVQTNNVEVGVVVRDAQGKPVSGLTQADFQVFDSGKLQKTTFFSIETAPPVVATRLAPALADAPAPPPSPVVKPKPPIAKSSSPLLASSSLTRSALTGARCRALASALIKPGKSFRITMSTRMHSTPLWLKRRNAGDAPQPSVRRLIALCSFERRRKKQLHLRSNTH